MKIGGINSFSSLLTIYKTMQVNIRTYDFDRFTADTFQNNESA